MIEDIDIKLTLLGKTGHGHVARSDKGSSGVVGILAKADVKLRVERMAQEKFDRYFSVLQLLRKALKSFFIVISGSSNRQLRAELFRELSLETKNGLVVESLILFRKTH